MEHPYLFFIKLFEAFGCGDFAHDNPHIIYSWVVMLLLIVSGFIATRSISLVPGKMQNFFELIVTKIENFMVDIAGEEIRWMFPLIATVFLYVFIGNLIGLIPGFFPPTANINTPLSIALVVFVLTHVVGIKYHGAKYIKHFLGPVWWLSPLFFIIELIGHSARIISLTFRLFGNMTGHEIVLMILFSLAGLYLAPLPIMILGLLVAFIQGFVFFLLSIIYFSGSIEHAH